MTGEQVNANVKMKGVTEGEKVYEHRIRRSTFSVRHNIWVDHNLRENTSMVLSVASPWGNATAYFPNCGECDWREWLTDVGEDYIGSKLFGNKTRVPDYRKTLSGLRGLINEMQQENVIDVDKANQVRRRLRQDYGYNSEVPDEVQCATLIAFLRRDETLAGFDSPIRYSENPRFRSFKRNAWLPFMEHLRAELDYERRLEPDTATPLRGDGDVEPEMSL